MYKNKETVEKEFDKRFEQYWRGKAIPDEVKFWIAHIRNQDLESLREWVEKQKKGVYGISGYADGLMDAYKEFTSHLNSLSEDNK